MQAVPTTTSGPTVIRIISVFAALTLLAGDVLAQSGQSIQVQATASAQQLMRDAEARLAANDAAGAYAMLSAREAELAGNAYFDYLLGVAALDSGRNGEAIFSLQRALAVEPRFSGARMELARAYFEAGDNDQARPLFVSLLDEQPPAGVRDILLRYIDAIDARPAAPRPRFTPFVEVTGGNDSNANGSTSSQQFLGFMLNPNNVETESPFGELALGFTWSVPTRETTSWYLGTRASYRDNPDAPFVDTGILSAVTGFTWRKGNWFGRYGADGYWTNRDGSSNESYGGADFLVGRSTGERWEWSFGLRTGGLRFDSAIDVLDVDRTMYTLGASYRFSGLSSLTLEAITGNDEERESGSPYGRTMTGGRIGLRAPIGPAHLYVAVGSLTSDYDGLFFGGRREDDQLSSTLQLEFRDVFTDGFSIVPRVRYTDNDSDITLYQYDRMEVGLMFRWMPQ
jgi:tetratricopeptide (TPR) repeat protein